MVPVTYMCLFDLASDADGHRSSRISCGVSGETRSLAFRVVGRLDRRPRRAALTGDLAPRGRPPARPSSAFDSAPSGRPERKNPLLERLFCLGLTRVELVTSPLSGRNKPSRHVRGRPNPN